MLGCSLGWANCDEDENRLCNFESEVWRENTLHERNVECDSPRVSPRHEFPQGMPAHGVQQAIVLPILNEINKQRIDLFGKRPQAQVVRVNTEQLCAAQSEKQTLEPTKGDNLLRTVPPRGPSFTCFPKKAPDL